MRLGKLRIVGLALVCLIAIWLELRNLNVKSLPPGPAQTRARPVATPDYALLPESEAIAFSKLFVPDSKTNVEAWEPTVADIQGLEENLSQISTLNENGKGPSRHIDDPHRYLRQYLAIALNGKPKILVNALCMAEMNDPNRWRKHLELAADGGACFWHADYDPSTQKFSNLMINGVG